MIWRRGPRAGRAGEKCPSPTARSASRRKTRCLLRHRRHPTPASRSATARCSPTARAGCRGAHDVITGAHREKLNAALALRLGGASWATVAAFIPCANQSNALRAVARIATREQSRALAHVGHVLTTEARERKRQGGRNSAVARAGQYARVSPA